MIKTFAIANQKGGVGKTTTTVNLGACLAAKDMRVLVIDADPQGNTSSGLGIERENVEKTTYDVILGGYPLGDARIQTETPNLSICTSRQQLAGAEIELVTEERREFRLKDAIETVRDDFDYILIDCPPSLGIITLNALTAADSVIIPIQCEYYALEGLGYLVDTIKQVRKVLNPLLDIEGVLLTMFDSRTNLSLQVVEEVKRCFPHKVYKSVIPRNVRLSEAPSFGQPIITYDPTSRGAECYMALAEEVLNASYITMQEQHERSNV